MENETENLNSSNETADGQQDNQTETASEDNSEVATLKEQNRQLFARAKKAEGFELKDGKWVKAQKPEIKSKSEESSKKSDELDYALELKTELAFHNTKSNSLKVENDEEVEFVKNLKQETGKSIGALLNSKYFQTEFKAFKDSKIVDIAANTPDKGRGGNQVPASKSVEYWMNKPDTEWPEQTYENTKLINDIASARYIRAKG